MFRFIPSHLKPNGLPSSNLSLLVPPNTPPLDFTSLLLEYSVLFQQGVDECHRLVLAVEP